MKILFLSLLMTVSTCCLSAQNRLEAVENKFDSATSGYDGMIKKLLLSPDNERFLFWYLVLPSFEREYFMGGIYDNGQPYIVYRIAGMSIGEYENQSKRTVTEIKKRIDRESLELLRKLLSTSVSTAKRPVETEEVILKFDGTSYYFSVKDSGNKIAKAWTPIRSSQAYKLVEIMERITRYVKEENTEIISFDADFRAQIVELTRKFS